jgi:CRP/FNR family transcriptional regulator, cyclic AMP receptor protein
MAQRKRLAPDHECPVGAPEPCALCSRVQAGGDGNDHPFHLVRRTAGSIVLRHGYTVEHVILVRSGRIKLSVADATGSERAYAMRGAGSLLGLEALLGMPAMLNGRVDIEGEMGIVEPAVLERWLASDGLYGVEIAKHVIADNARLTAERLLVDGNSEARIARFLLERQTNAFLAAWKEVARHEMAGLLSMRPETLSRAVRSLQERNAIGPGLEIRDVEKLRLIAHEDGSTDF